MARSYIYRTAVIYTGIIVVVANVTLDFQPEKIRLNDDINITCTVQGIAMINSNVTRQWSKGTDLICYNGHPIDYLKYTEISITGNKFKLQIKNVSESDVNSKYQCRYDFYTGAKSLPLSDDDEYPPADDVRAIVHYNESDEFLTVDLHFKKVFPMPRCAALIEGKRSFFNTTSTKRFGDYYEVVLLYQSTEKLHCNAEVVVKCKLIKEYNILTEDHRKCSSKENPSEVLSTLVPILLILTISISIFVGFFIRKKKKPCLSQQDREIQPEQIANEDDTLI